MTHILGIDPGTHRIGWGIIERVGNKSKLIDCGCLEFLPSTEASHYLKGIYTFFTDLLQKHSVSIVAVEKLFAQHNQKTVIKVAEARGVILLALADQNITYKEYSPNTIKLAVAGSGRANKAEVDRMVRILLGLNNGKLLDDTTDALAAALTATA